MIVAVEECIQEEVLVVFSWKFHIVYVNIYEIWAVYFRLYTRLHYKSDDMGFYILWKYICK